MQKRPLLNISTLLLFTLMLGGYGSALYFWLDEKSRSVDVALEEPSASIEPFANIKSSAKIKPSSIIKYLATKEPLARKESLARKKSLAENQSSTRKELSKYINHSVRKTPPEKTKPPATTKPLAVLIAKSLDDPKKERLTDSVTEYSTGSIKESSTDSIDKTVVDSLNTLLEEMTNAASTESLVQALPSMANFIEKHTIEKPIAKSEFYFQGDLATQAELRLQSNVTYDGRYVRIGYPMGDVPAHIGVCTDVVIRSFRGLGIDLQQRVHEDMKRNFRSYPNNWQLTKPDSNIDHRRVPNLMTYFKRAGGSLKISNNPLDYDEGNIVAWDLGGGLTHIGIVSSSVSELTGNPLIVHNIGAGPEMNDMLFKHKIIGHYKYGDTIEPSQDLAEIIFKNLNKNPEGFVFNTN